MIIIIIIIKTFDVTVPGGKRVGEKENEKIETYQKPYRELQGFRKRELSG